LRLSLMCTEKRSNGEVEGPRAGARLEPRVHNVSGHPRRHYRLSRTPPTIVRWLHVSQALDDKATEKNQRTTEARQNQNNRDPYSNAAGAAEAIKPLVVQNGASQPFEKCQVGKPTAKEPPSRARCVASQDSRRTGERPQRRQWPATQLPRSEDAEVMQPSNGEVEGPPRSAQSEPWVHTVFQHPRRYYRPSRTPPNDC